MTKFEPGETVAVPATVQPGAFTGEYLVTIPTQTGPVSGFVRDRDMVNPSETIHGIVRRSTSSSVSIQLSGSYFTTNGLVEFSSDWVHQNVKAIA